MKLLIAILAYFAFYATHVTSAPDHEKEDDVDLNAIIDSCAADLNLLIEETRRSFSVPAEVPGNCVTACVWKKIGLMDFSGKLIKNAMMASIHPTLEQLPNITKVTEDNFYSCVDEANKYNGGCTVIAEYFKCLISDLFSINK